jgi:hypothetical protein
MVSVSGTEGLDEVGGAFCISAEVLAVLAEKRGRKLRLDS